MDLAEEIRKLEEYLLQPETRASSESLACLLADDFIVIGGTGQTFGKNHVLGRLPSETPAQWVLDDFQVRSLSPDLILATYRAVRHSQPGDTGTPWLRSSIWTVKDERWQMTFHRGRG